ncbi:chaplin family protein [Streptomyces sp. FXJ1.172]|uniref:chaplin n=1 Tax=Streptomyces sp. FXJ1.172 TaxID=710705 RepID=UPI0007CF235E|nr:chaplin [Streptomyces sp. FXJ1.172]WEO97321.1 chaplin family protein [Streptomyces sp. FXJ1.172]
MRQTLSKGIVVAAAATGVLSLYGGSAAFADTRAHGAAQGSPGLLSGNNVQAPVDVPVNVCGNSADAAAALNPAFGNSCANEQDSVHRAHAGHKSHAGHGGRGRHGSHGSPHRHPLADSDDRSGHGDFVRDSGYGDLGRDVARDSGYGDLLGPGSTTPPSYGDDETTPASYGGDETTAPPRGHRSTPPGGGHSTPPGGGRTTPPPGGSRTTPPHGGGEHHPGQPPALAHTGGDARSTLAASAASAALIAAGTVLYRRGRSTAHR